VNLLEHTHGLLDDPEKNKLVWVHGMAGVGKSAVAFTVAERMRSLEVKEGTTTEKRLAGTFFFSRKYTKRCTTGSFFATLGYQLAGNFPSIKADLKMAIRENPALLDPTKSLRDQMEALFLQPLRRLQPRLHECPPLVFVIDALDECTSRAEIAELICLLGQALRDPGLPVIHILLTSRSEEHILKAIDERDIRPLVCEIPVKISGEGVTSLLSLDGADVDSDIYKFLEHSFADKRSHRSNFPRPTENELAQLASRAGRRFIVASTMMNFIDDGYSDPRDRLQLMLKLTSQLLPGTEVHKLYDLILLTCSDPKRAHLHLSVVAALANPLPISQISDLLGPGEGRDVETVLVQLRSVMDIPTDTNLPVNIYHSSIRDYVLEPSNCSLFDGQCTIPSPHFLLAYSSFRLMIQEIPESTGLLDAFLKLQTQNQATESHAPQSLRDSLAFIVEPPTPVRVIMALLWHRGDRNALLYPWIETPDGRAWLCTLARKIWLETEGGLYWLETQAGLNWLFTLDGKCWLLSLEGRNWLESPNGKEWLHSQSGKDWRKSQNGRDWLKSQNGRAWSQPQGKQGYLQLLNSSDPHEPLQKFQQVSREQISLEIPGGEVRLQTRSARIGWGSGVARSVLPTRVSRRTQISREWLVSESAPERSATESGEELLATEGGEEWLATEGGGEESLGWLETHSGREWLETPRGQEWLQTQNAREWLQNQSVPGWLHTSSGQEWLRTWSGRVWLQTQSAREWLQTQSAQEWLQTSSGREWLPSWNGQKWLQTRSARDWLQTQSAREWLQTPHGQAWQSTPAASFWVHMEEFLDTVEAINKFTIIPELSSLPAFQAIQQFKSLPDFLMFPAFLTLTPQSPTSPLANLPDMEILRVFNTFVSFTNEARERSRSSSDALTYACQNWAMHYLRAPTPWMLDHIFKVFWDHHLLSWFERQWCLKGLQSCLDVLSEGQKLITVCIFSRSYTTCHLTNSYTYKPNYAYNEWQKLLIVCIFLTVLRDLAFVT